MPVDTPVTIPETEPTVAMESDELLHEPPLIDEESVVVCDGHMVSGPDMVPAPVLTVTCRVMKQLVGSV